jgi:phosphohistidine phosphatase
MKEVFIAHPFGVRNPAENYIMDIYVIRHADAVAVGERNITEDGDRPLSEVGEAQAKAVGSALDAMGINPALVVTSPLLRARQTAEGIVQQLKKEHPAVQEAEEAAPGLKPKRLARYLRGVKADTVAVVGHEPDLSEWAAWLIGGRKAHIDLAKAGIALIRCPEGPRKGSCTLVWLVTPDWLAARNGQANA